MEEIFELLEYAGEADQAQLGRLLLWGVPEKMWLWRLCKGYVGGYVGFRVPNIGVPLEDSTGVLGVYRDVWGLGFPKD